MSNPFSTVFILLC